MASSNSSIKIHAFLAAKGVASRRKAEEMVAKGSVSVNGQVAKVGQRINPRTDQVMVNGTKVNTKDQAFKYYLVYKPIGYISTTVDELGRKNVLDILPKITTRLYPVGRLDQESEGLMLLTNDGDLAYKLTHPKFEVKKTYQATLDRDISEAAFDHLYKGVKLKDGFAATKRLEFADPDKLNILSITVTEGRNRLVRRMLERVGYDVIKLVRTHMGPFTLSQLNNKQYLELTAADIQSLPHSYNLVT